MAKRTYEEVKAEIERLRAELPKSEGALLEAKEYLINGQVFVQDYLNIADTIKITNVFKSVKWDNVKDPMSFLSELHDQGALGEFFNIVLKGEAPLDVNRLRPVDAVRVITDFFFMNEASAIIEIVISKIPAITNQLMAVGTKLSPSSPREK